MEKKQKTHSNLMKWFKWPFI